MIQVLTAAACALLLLALTPALAPVWAGNLFHTPERLTQWRERMTHGPYKSAGDVQPGSPGDYDRIAEQAAAFLANPAVDRYLGRSTCPTTQQEGPFGGTSWSRGMKLQSAAFLWLLTQERRYLDPVVSELLVHAHAEYLNWASDTLFGCADFQGEDTLPWNSLFLKYAIGYSFLRDALSATERTTLDTWFRQFGERMENRLHVIVSKRFPQRKSGDYTVAAGYRTCPESGGDFAEPRTLYVDAGPYQTCSFHTAWHNPQMLSALSVGLIGLLLDHPPLQDEARRFFLEHLAYTQWPDGTQGETYRWHTGTALHGMSYAGNVLIMLGLLAEAFDVAGDASLYAAQTRDGFLSSQVPESQPAKTLKQSLLEYQNRVNGSRQIYAETVSDATKLDADLSQCCNWQTVNDVLAGAIVSRHYNDPAITDNYRRVKGPPYSTSLKSSCGNGGTQSLVWSSGDAWCLVPGTMLMFAGFEGR